VLRRDRGSLSPPPLPGSPSWHGLRAVACGRHGHGRHDMTGSGCSRPASSVRRRGFIFSPAAPPVWLRRRNRLGPKRI